MEREAIWKPIYETISWLCDSQGLKVYLIGANARDFHFVLGNAPQGRITRDVDLAVDANFGAPYQGLADQLVQHGFRRLRAPYRFVHEASDTIVDLIPLGVENAQGQVEVGGRDGALSVVGMRTVLANSESIGAVRVASLAGIVVLKLIAYNERPEFRQKDLGDIKTILQRYFDLYEDAYWERCIDHIELIRTEEYFLEGGALLLGMDMAVAMAGDTALLELIQGYLRSELGTVDGPITCYWRENVAVSAYDPGEIRSEEKPFADEAQVRRLFELMLAGLAA